MWKFSWKAIQELEEHQKLLATSLANEAEDSIHIEDEKDQESLLTEVWVHVEKLEVVLK